MQQSLTLEIIYPYPPERVWHALTDQQTLAAWMMDNNFEAELGYHFQFQDSSLPGLEAVIDCEVIVINPLQKLVYTWKDRWMDRPSLVTWMLLKVEGGTQLTLHHGGLATASVSSPVTRLSGAFGQQPIALANREYHHQPNDPLLGAVSLGLSITGNWDYRLKQVLPTILAKSIISQS